MSASRPSSVWRADHRTNVVPFSTDAGLQECPAVTWLPLIQGWVDRPTASFQPGHARLSWDAAAIYCDVIFAGANPCNRAREHHERLWELGDTCEIFLRILGSDCYAELEISPQNHRLQLLWPESGHADVAAGMRRLEEFMILTPDWVFSQTQVDPLRWTTSVRIPFSSFRGSSSIETLQPDTRLNAAVCRYDYGASATPVKSSTARLRLPVFHRTHEWSSVELQPPSFSPEK